MCRVCLELKELELSMANNTNSPNQPYQAGPLPGVANQGMPTQAGQVGHSTTQNVGGITVVNSTGDPRVIWEDGKTAIIHARDFPAGTGMGRSPSRKDIKDAIVAQIDPARQNAVGPGSAHDFIKVDLKELLARPMTTGKKLPVSPHQFRGRPEPKPMIASGYGHAAKGVLIPDGHFPHICGMCGGWYYQGTGEHSTGDGKCPATSKPSKKR